MKGVAETTWAGGIPGWISGHGPLLAVLFGLVAAVFLALALRPGRRRTPATFFDAAERERIRDAIARAEKRTAGEIRVHLARRTQGEVLDAAKAAFVALRMDATENRTGLLIYLSVADRRFAIVGDAGIDAVVPPAFWEGLGRDVEDQFAQDRFVEGIMRAVELVGEALRDRVPVRPGDRDELSNEVSTD